MCKAFDDMMQDSKREGEQCVLRMGVKSACMKWGEYYPFSPLGYQDVFVSLILRVQFRCLFKRAGSLPKIRFASISMNNNSD